MDNAGVADRLVLEIAGVVDDAAQRMPNWLTAIAALAATAAAAIAGVTLESANYADEAAKDARKLGVSIEAYTALAFAADLAGASQSDLITSSRALAAALDAAGRGTQEYVDALAAVGLSYEDATAPGEDFATLLPRILDGLKGIDDPLRRMAVQQRLLGRSAQSMASLVAEGGDAIRKAADEARRFGLVVSEDAAGASEALNDDITRLSARVRGLALTFGLRMVPAADRLVVALSEMFDAIQPDVVWLLERAADALSYTLDLLLTPVGRVTVAMGAAGLLGVVLRNTAALGALLTKIPLVGGALGGMVTSLGAVALAAAPWLVALGAMALALDDVDAYLKGAPSLLGDFAAATGTESETYRAVSAFSRLLEEAGGFAKALATDGIREIDAALADLEKRLGTMAAPLTFLRDTLAALLGISTEQLLADFAGGAEFVGGALQQAREVTEGTRGTAVSLSPQTALAVGAVREFRAMDEARAITYQTTAQDVVVNVNGAQDPALVADEVQRALRKANRDALSEVQ